MFKTLLRASLLLAPVVAQAVAPAVDIDELHQRQFRYARAMMQLNQLEGFERGPSIEVLLRQEREAKAKRAEERWRDPADVRTQSMDEFAKAVEQVAGDQRAKRTMSRQWLIDEPYPSHWSVSGNEAAAADCARAIEHPLDQPLRIEMNRDGVAWLRVTAPGKGYWAFDTLVSEFDTKLSVYRDCRDIESAPMQVADDSIGLGSIVGLDAKAAGQRFLIKLERKGGVGSVVVAKGVAAQSISGHVRRASDSTPVAHGRVVVRYNGDWRLLEADGSFTIPIYSPGSYQLRAYGGDLLVSEGYPSAPCFSNASTHDWSCDGELQSVTVAAGQQVENIDFSLNDAAVLAGIVVDDETGAPIPSAVVSAMHAGAKPEPTSVRIISADAAGRYRIAGLSPGAWRLQFEAARYKSERWHDVECPGLCQPGSGDAIDAAAGQTIWIEGRLSPSPYLAFPVRIAGAPLAGASVLLFDENGQYLQTTYSNAQGIAEATPPGPGPFRAMVHAANAFPHVVGWGHCATANCEIELGQGALILSPTGVVTLPPIDLKRLPAVTGTVISSMGGAVTDGAAWITPMGNGSGAYAYTDAQGKYDIPALFPGDYSVRFVSPSHVDEVWPDIPCDVVLGPQCPFGNTLTISPSSPALITLDAELVRAPMISGRVQSLQDRSIGTVVFADLLSDDGGIVRSWALYPEIEHAEYVLTSVPLGAFRLGMQSHNFMPQVFDGIDCGKVVDQHYPCSLVGAPTIDVPLEGVREAVDFKLLADDSRRIKVLDEESGVPVAGVNVDLWTPSGDFFASARTDVDGEAAMSSQFMPTSHPVLVSTDNTDGFTDEVYDDRLCPFGGSVFHGTCSLAGATPVPLTSPTGPLPAIEIQLSRDLLFATSFE
ncbi:MAG: carboxypeptidase regulatory-like domain-containing protein [Rhodanobacteraceae bacterium]|nr:carboxypeptidase regulatory-like domain-containing protein [Rhodanobacteraceae bacterium]